MWAGARGDGGDLTQAYPHLQATVVDLPTVAPITAKLVAEAGATNRVMVHAADVVRGPVRDLRVAIVRELLQVLSAADAQLVLQHIGAALTPGGSSSLARYWMIPRPPRARPWASISWVRFLEACFGFFPGVIVACMSDYRHKRHNVSSLLYHIVCPAKYRRVIFDTEVAIVLKDVCLDIAKRYEIVFLEIGTDKDHVHFLVQSVPSYSPTKIVQIIKSLTAREIFHRVPTVKKAFVGASCGQRLLHPYGRPSRE